VGLGTGLSDGAPNYAAARSRLAKQMGLGQQRRRRQIAEQAGSQCGGMITVALAGLQLTG